jgi:hypothetical protein
LARIGTLRWNARPSTPEAREVLEKVVGGADNFELTRDAKASVRRLNKR